MPKTEPASNAELWNTIKKHSGQSSVAKIKPGPDQLQEIRRRLSALADDFGTVGASVTPVAARIALGLDEKTYERYIQAKAQKRDESGNPVDITLDKSDLNDAEKQYIIDRSQTIKNYLQDGEALALLQAQAKDNRENGGSLWIAQNVFAYGQDKAKDQITVSLEDLLAAAARIKERAQT